MSLLTSPEAKQAKPRRRRSPRSTNKFAERRSAGLCTCGKPAATRRLHCEFCLEKMRTNWEDKIFEMGGLWFAQSGVCNGCKHFFPFHVFTIDHIIPRKRGGEKIPGNLQLLCFRCNAAKNDRTMEEAEASGVFDKYRRFATRQGVRLSSD